LLPITARLPGEQVICEGQPVANRRHPLAAQDLVVDHVDVPQQVSMIERQRADDIRVVGKDNERHAIVASAADKRLDCVFRRLEPRLSLHSRRHRVPVREREASHVARRPDTLHRLLHAAREVEQHHDVEPAGLHHGVRRPQHRFHQRDRDERQGRRKKSQRQAANHRRAVGRGGET
jgi:hypothetical protein